MPVPRHAWWRGSELTWRRPDSGTVDVAGPAAPPTLVRQCRALIRGAAGPNKYRGQSRLPEQQARPPRPPPARWYLDGLIGTRRADSGSYSKYC